MELRDLPNEFLSTINLTKKFTFFCLNDIKVSQIGKQLPTLNLSERQLTVAKYLLVKSKTHTYITNNDVVEEVLDKFQIPKSSFRRHIQELLDIGLLYKITVTLDQKAIDRGLCYAFCSSKEIDKIALNRGLNISDSNRGNHQESRDSVKNTLQQMGLDIEQVDAKHYLQAGMAFDQSLVPLQYFKLAPEKRNGKNYNREQFQHSLGENRIGNYVIEALAHDQIVTKPALMTLVASINLAMAYNAKMLITGKYSRPFEIEEVPIHLPDIFHVRGIKDSGQARERINNHYDELRHTVYNWVDLTGIVDENMNELFRQKDFQFIVSLETNATIAPTIVDSNRVQTNAVLFFIRFHPDLIKKLCEKRYFFAVPKKIAMDDPLIFVFYLALRNSKVTIDAINLKSLANKMYFASTIKQLYKQLKKKLDADYLVAPDSPMATDFEYDLCGYYLRFSTNEDDEIILYAHCFEPEMIQESGATYKEELGNNNAPTLPNPLVYNVATVEDLKHHEQVQQVVNTLRNVLITKNTRRTDLYKKIKLAGEHHTLSAYSDARETEQLAENLAEALRIDSQIAFDAVEQLKGKLKYLSFGNIKIDESLFYGLKNHLATQHDIDLTPSQLIDAVKFYRELYMIHWAKQEYEVLAEDIIAKIKPR